MKMDKIDLILLIFCVVNFCVAIFNNDFNALCGWLVAILLVFR